MSWGASVAYAPVEEELELFEGAEWPGEQYAIQDNSGVAYMPVAVAPGLYRATGQYVQQPPQYVEYVQPYYAYPEYEPEYGPGTARSRQLRQGLAAALFALALIGMMVVVGPVFASDPLAMRLSGYRDGMGTVAGMTVVNGAPVIDTTSGAVPQEQAAEVAPPAQTDAPSGPHDVVGAPTLSVAQIEKVLASYGSPAVGLGQKLYDLGIKYGINPAYALAFFVHESGCGTKGVARFSKSLGNIRWTPGYNSYEGYRSYSSWEAGMEDWYVLIKDLYIAEWGLRTVDAIIPVYAPSGDNNDPTGYIASVKYMVDSWRGR